MAYKIIFLLLGGLFGCLVQFIKLRVQYENGDWESLSSQKKAAMTGTGGVASLVVGLWYLDGHIDIEVDQVIYRLWFFQSLAGYLGDIFLDLLSRHLFQKYLSGKSKK